MAMRRYTHNSINGEYITLDDLEMFVTEMRGLRGMPGTATIRFRGLIEIDFNYGPRAASVTAEAEPSADDLRVSEPAKADERQQV